MAEYIDRTALGIGKANREIFKDPAYADGWNAALEIIQAFPAADVAPVVHGRWKLEPTNPYDDPGYKNRMIKRCSCCGWQNACRYNYCPNCGAKMDLE